MSYTINDLTVNKLMHLAEAWACQFDKAPPLEVRFGINSFHQLTLNGIVLGPVSEIDADGATYDVEYLHIPTTTGSYFEVHLHWGYEGTCEIRYISRIQMIYCADPTGPAE